MKVDKSIELTDKVVDELIDDWFERDGETFLKIRKSGRIGWEETLEEGESYSAYLLEAPTQEDLIKRAYSLAKETIVVMDAPFKVRIRITTGRDSASYTDSKVVCVNTAMFDDPELSVGEKLDTFLGTVVHEGCHLLYTDFTEMHKITNKAVGVIFNILEDERIEELCGERKPGLANFLEKSKYYYFDQYYLDYVVPKEEEGTLTLFDRFMNVFLHIIRYPKYLKESEIIEFGHYLLAIKELIVPFYPNSTEETIDVSYRIFDMIKELYKGEKGGEKSDEEIMKDLLKDAEDSASGMKRVAADVKRISRSVVSSGEYPALEEEDLSKAVLKDSELLGEICEGVVEVGSSDDSFFTRMPDEKTCYKESLRRVERYVSSISRILKGHCREYKLTHRSMRSGILDTNKLAEAYQGVPTVYIREGEVTTDKVSVCVLIDESGSMSGERIKAARDTAVLINEAIGNIPNVELFIYGHSGDMKRSFSTEMYIYREKDYNPKFSLGSVEARAQNRDGIAILEIAKRVRSQTRNPVLFFILSDGSPCAGSYGGKTAMNHVRDCVHKVERMDFTVVQVCINHVYDPSVMFDHFIILEDMSRLAFELGNVIKKATMKASKINVT